MVNEKDKMDYRSKDGIGKGLRGNEGSMFVVQPNVNVNVDVQMRPFGVVQETDTIYFDIPKEEISPSLQALPASTVVMDTIDLQDDQ